MTADLNTPHESQTAPLSELLRPRSIAVVGASQHPEAQGHRFLALLQDFGFRGPVYPVNSRYSDILGLPCYPDLLNVPGPVDYVISCIPASGVLELLEQAPRKGVNLIHLFTARFSETGRAPATALEREILQQARRRRIRLLGPNCMGLYDPEAGISFKYNLPHQPGPVGLLSQSGGLAVRIVSRGGDRGLRFTQAVSYGNALDINECDLLLHFAADPGTRVIGAYIEGVKDGQRFLTALRQAAALKPVVLLKGGRTGAGSRATLSHTASLAGSRQAWTSAVKQAGAVEVADPDEMMDVLLAFAFLPAAAGRRVGVAGGGGGPMVLSSDGCEEAGLAVEPLPPQMRSWLKESAPQVWDWVTNPVDSSILFGSGLTVEDILRHMASSAHFDLLIGVFDDDGPWGPAFEQGRLKIAVDSWTRLRDGIDRPLAVVLGTMETGEEWRWRAVVAAQQRLAASGVPAYPSVHRAARALSLFAGYWQQRPGLAL